MGKSTIARIGRKTLIEVHLHASGASKSLYANPPDWPEMLVWQQRLGPGDLFVDVGANAGVYALWTADLGADVIAVEPSRRACQWLRRNIELNGLPITVIEAALTDFEGTVGFDSSGDAVGHIGGPEVVAATTLDAVLGQRRAAGVKIDVEGFERLVLQGATEALAEHRIECIQLEWNQCSQLAFGEDRSPTAALLAEFGYRLHRPADDGRLYPIGNLAFGPDVFALPRLENAPR
ncbi:MAG TPA: FkbM family methyltransferase [Acidimicrobiales bacterium]|nr:FkbM family methyltransferase [Acidimicrobiales bacterium]